MPEVNSRTLVVAIQAVDAERHRLRSLPDEDTVPGDHVFLVDLENAADELEQVYKEATKTISNLPSYAQLVHRG